MRFRDILSRLEPSMYALAYLVEGSGFTAAAARATLIALKVFGRHPHPVYVEKSLRATVARMMDHLDGGAEAIDAVEKAILDGRRAVEQVSFKSRAS
jgi:hypothetical protein